MKKLLSFLCIMTVLCTCAACSRKNPTQTQPTDETTPTYEFRDPQKENAIPTDDLSRYATKTGMLTNYRVATGYTSTTENIVTIVLHDGVNQQTQRILHNTINPDGTVTLTKKEDIRYVWSENAKYQMQNDEEKKLDYSFSQSAAETTFASTVNALTCDGFYETIAANMSTATYNIVKDYYELDAMQLTHGNETLMFEDVHVVVSSKYIESIHCSNGTQTITIELTGIDDVDFGANE